MTNHYQAIQTYNRLGLCSLPCSISDKYPSMIKSWAQFLKRQPTAEEIVSYRAYSGLNYGCCIICGAISGGLEVIDIDNHLGTAEATFNEFINIPEVSNIIGSYDIPIETTKSGGYHLFFKSDSCQGNLKLATVDKKTVIETRGEGGLIVCAPTKGYEIISGSLDEIPKLSNFDRSVLLSYCRSFDKSEHKEPERAAYKSDPQTGERPGDIYNRDYVNEAKGLLESIGWVNVFGNRWRRPGKDSGVSATFGHVAENVFYTFSANSSPFEERHAYKPFDIYTIIKHNGNYQAAAKELSAIFNPSYNLPKRASGSVRADVSGLPEISGLPENQPSGLPQRPNKDVALSGNVTMAKWTRPIWEIVGKKTEIDFVTLREFLEHHGFFLYRFSDTNVRVMRSISNIIEPYDWKQLRDFILDHLKYNENRLDIYNLFMRSSKFAESTISNLPEYRPNFIRDTKTNSYFFFKDVIVEATADGLTVHEYGSLNGAIWKSQIIDRQFRLTDDFEFCDAAKFARLVCNNQHDRVSAYKSAIGYMLHRYKLPSRCPAIVYNDENESDEANGGTGKGLSIVFVSQIRNVATIPAKSFDPDNSFCFQRVGADTDLIYLDDIDKKFDFEKLFPIITGGLAVSKKYQGEQYIEFADSPKWGITTNYPLKSTGTSFKRRLFEIEIYPYFSPNLTPADEFNREIIIEWDSDEWNRFDNWMINNCVHFLKNDLVAPEYVTLNRNKLIRDTCPEFVDFADEFFIEGMRYEKQYYLRRFKDKPYATNYIKFELSTRRFTDWAKHYADYKKWSFNARCGSGNGSFEFSNTPGVDAGTGITEQPENEVPF